MEVRDKCDQVVRECLTKIAQTVLQARITFQPAERKKINKWVSIHLYVRLAISNLLAISLVQH
jgi:hypothetical protein